MPMTKPELKNVQTLHLLDALEYVEEVNNLPGYKRRVMDLLKDNEFIPINDVYVEWFYTYPEEYFEDQDADDIRLLNETFGITENSNVLMDVSW